MAQQVGDNANLAGHDGTIIVQSIRGIAQSLLVPYPGNPGLIVPHDPNFFPNRINERLSMRILQSLYAQSAANYLGSNRWRNQTTAATGFCGFEVLARALDVQDFTDELEVGVAFANLDPAFREAYARWLSHGEWLDADLLMRTLIQSAPGFEAGIYYIRLIVNCSVLRENCSAAARDCSAGRHERATAQASHTALTARRVLLRVLVAANQMRAGRFVLNPETTWIAAEVSHADAIVAGLKACNDPFVLYSMETMGNPDTNGAAGGRHFQLLRNTQYVQPAAAEPAAPAGEPAGPAGEPAGEPAAGNAAA